MLKTSWTILVALTFTALALGDRKLEPAEVEQLIETLTSQPRQSWIPFGMIQAHHLQYFELENKITDSTETIYFDGQLYALQVDLNPDASLDMNLPALSTPMDRQTPSDDFLTNRSNFYVWNGHKQVRYYKASDYAVVLLGQEGTAPSIYGPPSAAVIPWGHGDFSPAVLRANNPSAYELNNSDGTRILLEYTDTKFRPAARITILLDSVTDYSVVSYSRESEMGLLRNTYDNYHRAGEWWVPHKIMSERFDKSSGQPRLIAYDDWQFEKVIFEKPNENRFAASFAPGTIVEMQPAQSVDTLLYQASENQDIEPLLQDKISFLSDQTEAANCATAAMSHIARKFSKSISPERITGLASKPNRKTSLSDLKTALEEIGLECMAVTTDIENLGKFGNCIKLVHLPINNHYVIVDRVEPDAVWVIDLTSRKFYWKKLMNEFLMEWNEGTALLVSDTPIYVPTDSRFSYLDMTRMATIEGGNYTGYSCTDKIQDYQHILCPQPWGDLCAGLYYVYYERYGCKEDVNGGTCVGQRMLGYETSNCIDRLEGGCTITGIWTNHYIRACQ